MRRHLERFFGPEKHAQAPHRYQRPITFASSGPEGLFMAMSSVPWKTETMRMLPPVSL